jgi:spore coat-associated protein N
MNIAKKALLVTSLSGALVVSAGFGTYSWFTSGTSASGTVDNGTLLVNNGKPISTKLFEATNFAPSQYVLGNFVTLDNTGTLDQVLKLTYSATVDKASADPYKIYYLAFKYKQKPTHDQIIAMREAWEKGFFDGNNNPNLTKTAAGQLPDGVELVTGEVSLAEAKAMAAADANKVPGSKVYAPIGDDKFFTLASDQYIDIVFDVKLDENAGNEYQGAKYAADLKVEARQTDRGAKY